jgi:hypothetical protein
MIDSTWFLAGLDLIYHGFVAMNAVLKRAEKATQQRSDDAQACCSGDNDNDSDNNNARAAAIAPQWQAFAYQPQNRSFEAKLCLYVHAKMTTSVAERQKTCNVLSALHGFTKILSWDPKLIPMVHDVLLQCNHDQQQAFAYLVANDHLYAHLFTEEWCLKRGCVSCSLPRHKSDHDASMAAAMKQDTEQNNATSSLSTAPAARPAVRSTIKPASANYGADQPDDHLQRMTRWLELVSGQSRAKLTKIKTPAPVRV